MDSYKVKELMWLIILGIVIVIFLTGCGSSPKIQAQKPQYCHTSQEILVKNGERVESATLVECTDDQFKRLAAVRMGMANNCGISNRTIQTGGKLVNIQVKSCQILDHNGNVVGYEYVH
jgi:hypothetical protein